MVCQGAMRFLSILLIEFVNIQVYRVDVDRSGRSRGCPAHVAAAMPRIGRALLVPPAVVRATRGRHGGRVVPLVVPVVLLRLSKLSWALFHLRDDPCGGLL